MRHIAILLMFLSISSICFSEQKDIKFQDNKGNLLKLSNFSKQSEKLYGVSVNRPYFILITSPNSSNVYYKRQNATLENMHDDVEENAIVIITACPNACGAGSYHVLPENSKDIRKFRVQILNQDGRILISSDAPLTRNQILKKLNDL